MAHKKYNGGGRIVEIEKEISEYQELIKDNSVPQDEKDFAESEISDLGKELSELKKAPAPASAKPAKAKKEPKPKKEKKAKVDKTALPSCEELAEKWEARKAAAKKANKAHKTVSISEKIGTDIAHAVKKIVDNVAAADIKAAPEKYIEKFKKVETTTKEFLDSLKSLLGDEFDRKELLEPFEQIIGKFIENVKKKYE